MEYWVLLEYRRPLSYLANNCKVTGDYTSEVLLARLLGRMLLMMPPRVLEVAGPRLRYLAQNCSVSSILGLVNNWALPGGGRGLRK